MLPPLLDLRRRATGCARFSAEGVALPADSDVDLAAEERGSGIKQ